MRYRTNKHPGGVVMTADPTPTSAGAAPPRGRPAEVGPLVIGIDPSLTATGIAWADGHTSVIKYHRDTTGDRRLMDIHVYVAEACYSVTHGLADLAVVEDLPTNAQGAGKTGMAQGVVRLAVLTQDVPYVTVPPATLKKFATGNGNADKHLMRMEAYKRAGIEFADDNQCDAWWLRAMGRQALGYPLVDLPKAHLEAMDKVTWPVTP
jgi:Holliday junction resolvasome RuvABC endonuclease subunit